MEKVLYLLDGHALVYRAHYSFMTRPLINSKGQNTSAVNGFVRMLWDIIQNRKPSHLAVSFDLPGGTFRNEMFSEYKANRDAQPEDITWALPQIFEIIKAFNIPVVTMPGFEADDVIGTLAKQAEKEGFKVYMMTPDKDYMQLVSENIFQFKPSRSGSEVEILGIPEVLANWGIERVDQVIDFLGLQGDSVDNIPGIPGIGPKTAQILLEKYGSLENIIANAHELKGKQQENVRNFAEQGILSKQLATIDINVPVQFHDEDYKLKPYDRTRLTELFRDLEFRSLANSILGGAMPGDEPNAPKDLRKAPEGPQQLDLFGNVVDLAPIPRATIFEEPIKARIADKNINNTNHEYHLMDTPEKRSELIQLLANQTIVSFDTESTSKDPNKAELVGISFSFKEHEGYYVPVPKEYEAAKAIVAEFTSFYENENIEKVGQNLKYDMILLKWYGATIKGTLFDTMLAHYLIEPELRHGMDYMSQTMLGYAPVPIEELIGSGGKNQLTMRDVAIEKVSQYAAEDADVTLQLRNVLAPKLIEQAADPMFRDIEIPLVRVLTDLEFEGIRIDPDFLNAYSVELEKQIATLEKNIKTEAGLNFNVASPKQVGDILFEGLKIPYKGKKLKSGQYSTDEETLSELAPDYPIVALILEHRGLSKLKSTYVDALPRMINEKTGRIHSSFNQALTATGRLSSNDPNLQNIPIKTPQGSEVRKAFIPRNEDFVLLSADYSQIELRLIAEISNDESMLEAFASGNDFHRATAAKVYDTPLDDVTAEQRRNAKTVNFSITYGAGSTNLSKQLGIPRSEAKELIENYFATYSGLKHYMKKIVEDARAQGYVSTLLGRRRYLRDIDSRNSLARSNAERMAINSPIQGTAADLIKIAMVNIHKILSEGNYRSKMILQVHDELVFDMHKDELETLKPIIENCMKTAIPNLKVPIEVGMGIGQNWLEAH
jgi:DNA polymerase I